MTDAQIPFYKKLSTRILFSALAGTVLGTAVVGLFAFLFTEAAFQRSIMDSQLRQAKQTMSYIDRLLYERQADIRAIASENVFESFILGVQEIYSVPDVYMKDILRRLDELTFLTGPWDKILLVRRDGMIVASTEGGELGIPIGHEPHEKIAYEAALRGEIYISDWIGDSDIGRPTVIFAAPIRDHQDPRHPTIGAAIGLFSWAAVSSILDEMSDPALLLDSHGKVISKNTHIDLPGSPAAFQNNFFLQALKEGRSVSALIPKNNGFLKEEALASLASQTGYLSYEGNHWGLLLGAPSLLAFKPSTETATKLVVFLIPFVAAAPFVILFLIIKLVIRPISSLSRTIRAITAGDLTQRAPVRSEDEIGQLAASFNAMTSKLQESHETLEKKVEQRTAALTKEIEDRKRLEKIIVHSEKMSAVGQLAAGVAHEINNPLGVILGFAQGVVRRTPPGDPLEMPLKSIEREAVRCKNLVQDLLAFSRAGKSEREKTDLNLIIEGSVSLVSAQAKVRNVEVAKELNPNCPQIFANKNQIQQVIVNLCNNAMDAMPQGGMLTIRTGESSLHGSPALRIEIRDTGNGIPPEIQSKIFEPFFTTKEVGKGTGLGLSLVYEIVQKHEGQIAVESETGKGTAFRIDLPIVP